MSGPPEADPLAPGLATSIGSLPHRDAHAAAELVLRRHPDLPAAPELPCRSTFERTVERSLLALPEVEVSANGDIRVVDVLDAPPRAVFDDTAQAGLLAFLDAAASAPSPQRRVKVQTAGPLTLGVALQHAGMPVARAFRRAGELARAWAVALEELVSARLPGTPMVLFLDEPALVLWRLGRGPLDHEAAVDLLSGALAAAGCTTGVHTCGAADLRLALEAGPRVLGLDVRREVVEDAAAIARHLDAGGWVAWGAVPTHRPVGQSCDPLWRDLVTLWCELTRRGCDPVLLRTQALVTPACGLAGHSEEQADHLLGLARQMAHRVHDHAVAARLTVGA
jgi:methionine synthase II (cobalamin-independent)